MADDRNELEALSAIVGVPVIAAEPCGWGFENRTAIATLEGGRRLVVQRISSRARAGHKLHLARVLPERLAAAGLRAPRLLAADAHAEPPYAVREYLPGVAAAGLMGTLEGAVEVARAMGALLPRLALVEIAGAGLGDTWASPDSLARQAQQQLDRCRPLLGAVAGAALEATIVEVAPRFAGRPARFAHGDFCPVNVLLGARDLGLGASAVDEAPSPKPHVPSPKSQAPIVVALLDLEFARVADALFDAAWWGWVVRYHHPERWKHAWPRLLVAAGIPDDSATAARVRVLQQLRCLEMVDESATTRAPEVVEMWVGRLRETLGWS